MNISGPLLRYIINLDILKINVLKFKVICDDLETDLGKVKISTISTDRWIIYIIIMFIRGHNGIKSIVTAFGHNEFEKIKIGIGRPNSKNPEIVSNYVLGEFSQGIWLLSKMKMNSNWLEPTHTLE